MNPEDLIKEMMLKSQERVQNAPDEIVGYLTSLHTNLFLDRTRASEKCVPVIDELLRVVRELLAHFMAELKKEEELKDSQTETPQASGLSLPQG